MALHEGTKGAVSWAEKSALKPGDFDPEGMSVLMNHQLDLGLWADAAATAREVDSEENYSYLPLAPHVCCLGVSSSGSA